MKIKYLCMAMPSLNLYMNYIQ